MRSCIAVLAAVALTGCAGRTLSPATGTRAHPADPEAPSSAFVPAPDPLGSGARESLPPSPSPAAGARGGHAGHAGHAGAHGDGHADSPTPEEGQSKPGVPEAPAKEGHHDPSHGDETPKPPAAGVPTDPVLDRYFALSRALVADDFAAATAALGPLRTAADAAAQAKDAAAAAAAAAVRDAVPRDPGTIEDLRKGLKALSDAVIALARTAPPTDAVAPLLRLAYCPMADASWLQAETEIQNPYMGKRMPHCGRVVETLETRAARGGD
jgi:hypothetical protein